VTVQGTPYDYASVMHYGADAFSKNGAPTIVSRRRPGEQLGQYVGLSGIDAQELNMLYKCAGEWLDENIITLLFTVFVLQQR
jgi:hypothetical protein